MSENKAGPLSGLKNMNPKARKGMFLVGGVGLVVVAVSGMMMGKDKQQAVPAAASLARPPAGPDGDPTSSTSPQYRKLIHEKDEARAREAAEKPGQMVLPKIAGLTDPNEKPAPGLRMTPGIAQPDQPAPQQYQQQYAQQQVQFKQADARQSPAFASVMTTMQHIVKAGLENDQASPFAVIAAPVDRQAQGQAAAGQGNAPVLQAGQQVNGGSNAAPLPLIRGGESLFATLDTAVNSDYTGPVVATIRQGKFAGSRLIGEKRLEQNAVVMKFTQMSPADGSPAFGIDAYAIQIADAKQFGQTGLQGNVDHHVMERWVLPAAAAFITAYGASAATPKQTITQNASTTTQTVDQLSPRDRMVVAAGAMAAPIASDLQTQAQRPITVSLESGTEIGILFTRDVVTATGQQTGQAQGAVAQPDASQQGRGNAGSNIQPLIVTPPAPAQAQPAYGNRNTYQQPAGYGPTTSVYGQQRATVYPYQGLSR